MSFTDRELDVMSVLWDRGPSTVREVQRHLTDRLAYTTVLTILRILEWKGYAAHVGEGRAYRYRPLVTRREAALGAVGRLIAKVFDGSPELMITSLLGSRSIPRQELKHLRRLFEPEPGRTEEE